MQDEDGDSLSGLVRRIMIFVIVVESCYTRASLASFLVNVQLPLDRWVCCFCPCWRGFRQASTLKLHLDWILQPPESLACGSTSNQSDLGWCLQRSVAYRSVLKLVLKLKLKLLVNQQSAPYSAYQQTPDLITADLASIKHHTSTWQYFKARKFIGNHSIS